MGHTSDLISAMTFLGIHHDPKRKHIDLVAWSLEDTVKFQTDLEAKFKAKRFNEDATTELMVKDYFLTHVKEVTDALRLTALTEADDHLLIMKSKTDYYVYFGGVTKTLVYISCWMVVPKEYETDSDIKPKLLFWFLNTLYVGQLQGLGETAVDADRIEQEIDSKSIPVYANRIDLKTTPVKAS